MPGDVRVKQIAAGATFSACLTETGNLVLFGTLKFSNENGREVMLMKNAAPHIVAQLRSSRITSIACGAAHILCLKSDGKLISFGCPTYGRLGRREPTNPDKESGPFSIAPITFPDPKDSIIQIACGHQHNLALTQSGAVYSWGRALHGQLGYYGNSNEPEYVLMPQQISDLSRMKIVAIACGANTSFALGPPPMRPVYSFGASLTARLASTDVNPVAHIAFFQVNKIPIQSIAAGFRHVIAVSENAQCYSWGLSYMGQCGHGDTGAYTQPKLIAALDGKKITRVSAGGNTSCAVSGMLYSALSEELGKLFDNASTMLPDVVIEIDTTDTPLTIWLHKCILSSRAPNLLAQCRTKADSTDLVYRLPAATASPRAYESASRSIFHYLYTDRINSATLDQPDLACELASLWGLDRFVALVRGDAPPPSTFLSDLLSLLPSAEDEEVDKRALLPPDAEDVPQDLNRPEYIGHSTSDVTFRIDGRELPVHRSILSARSEYYKTMFMGGMVEATQRFIDVDTGLQPTSYDAYLALMRFLYLDAAPQDVNIAIELIQLANMLHLTRLMSICEAMIQQSVDDESCCFVFMTAKLHGATNLVRYCAEFFSKRQKKISQTDFWKNDMSEEEKDQIRDAVTKL
eukprot:TRINITY_DN1934_c0_g1_i4.p1 TRINITY_DN1934_c0_g1~~TRINITY_DN1934_c0_g1_i4.p1  ORF type:complete len:633 (-),score=68.00 TRINITY_DN1934_c0_g1_i4:1562-3460(-)